MPSPDVNSLGKVSATELKKRVTIYCTLVSAQVDALTRADTVYSACKIGVGDGSVPRLDSPHGFAEGADCSRRIKDDLSPVKSANK